MTTQKQIDAEHEYESNWHLDKKVPLALVLMIVLQTLTIVYVGTSWKSDIDHRLTTLEKGDVINLAQESRIIVLEQKFDFIHDSLKRIEETVTKKGQ